jgi:hypothetical protein
LNEDGKAFKLSHYFKGMHGSIGGHSLFLRTQVSINKAMSIGKTI